MARPPPTAAAPPVHWRQTAAPVLGGPWRQGMSAPLVGGLQPQASAGVVAPAGLWAAPQEWRRLPAKTLSPVQAAAAAAPLPEGALWWRGGQVRYPAYGSAVAAPFVQQPQQPHRLPALPPYRVAASPGPALAAYRPCSLQVRPFALSGVVKSVAPLASTPALQVAKVANGQASNGAYGFGVDASKRGLHSLVSPALRPTAAEVAHSTQTSGKSWPSVSAPNSGVFSSWVMTSQGEVRPLSRPEAS